MKTREFTLQGVYFDGVTPEGTLTTLHVNRQTSVLTGNNIFKTYNTHQIKISPRIGRAARFIALPDGGQLQCEDVPWLDWFRQEVPSEGPVAWLEARPAIAVLSVAVIAILLLVGYFYGLPIAAERIARRIPFETTRALDDDILAVFDEKEWLIPSHIEDEKQASILRGFNELSSGLINASHYELEFRCSKKIGPNAMALPGGTIIITDQMINISESDEEILAVLAHEIGHVEHNHVMRQILQSSVVGVTVAAITADATSLGIAVSGLPFVLLNTKYSREFEAEADDFAFDLLEQNGMSPEAFADIMERLDKENELLLMDFLSSHPPTSERIENARKRVE